MSTDQRDTIDTPAQGAGLVKLIDQRIRSAMLDLRVAAPGTVSGPYDPVTQTVPVTVGFLRVASTEALGQEVEIPEPPELIPAARVAIAQGSLHSDQPPIPIVGDTGLLIFVDRALDMWIRAPLGAPVDPVNSRTHNVADAVFIPGLSPLALVSTPAANPLARTIEAPIVQLGAAATGFGVDGTALAAAVLLARGILAPLPAGGTAAQNALANAANKVAILALMDAIPAALSTKVMIE